MGNLGKWEESKPKAKVKVKAEAGTDFMTGNIPGDHKIIMTNAINGKNVKKKKAK